MIVVLVLGFFFVCLVLLGVPILQALGYRRSDKLLETDELTQEEEYPMTSGTLTLTVYGPSSHELLETLKSVVNGIQLNTPKDYSKESSDCQEVKESLIASWGQEQLSESQRD